MTRPVLRFSLRRFLLGLSIVALIVALWATTTELKWAKVELRQARRNTHVLEFSDIRKIHSRLIKSHSGYDGTGPFFIWKVFVPKVADRHFRLRAAVSQIPVRGIPESSMCECMIPGGEFLLQVRLERSNGGWELSVDTNSADNNHGVTVPIARSESEWLDLQWNWRAYCQSQATTSVDVGEPMVLLRLRTYEPHGDGGLRVFSSTDSESDWSFTGAGYGHPADGLMIWIEEQSDDPNRSSAPTGLRTGTTNLDSN